MSRPTTIEESQCGQPTLRTMGSALRVLVLSKRTDVLEHIERCAWVWPSKITQARVLSEALVRCREQRPTTIALALDVGVMQLAEHARALRERNPDAVIVVLADEVQQRWPVALLEAGADRVLKTSEFLRLGTQAAMERLTERRRLPAISGQSEEPPSGDAYERIAQLEALLTLTRGSIHDVNNLLTVLSGQLYLATESVRDDPELCEKLRCARNAAARGGELMREILDVARGSNEPSHDICPRNRVETLQPLFSRLLSESQTLRVEMDGDLSAVHASAVQFDSALTNLVLNARDALDSDGEICIRVANTEVKHRRAQLLGVSTGRYVTVEVIDDGCGIPETLVPYVVEPHHTTKQHGTGLGLTMVKRFAERAKGTLSIESQAGQGTVAALWLPALEPAAIVPAEPTMPLATLPGGDEHVWIAVRDNEVRASLTQILRALGYTTRGACSPEGLGVNAASRRSPDLIVSERPVAQPASAMEVLASLKHEYPGARHLALLDAGADPHAEAVDSDNHLVLPLTVPALARAVRSALGAAK